MKRRQTMKKLLKVKDFLDMIDENSTPAKSPLNWSLATSSNNLTTSKAQIDYLLAHALRKKWSEDSHADEAQRKRDQLKGKCVIKTCFLN